jgi:RecJ-like exonuclease
MKITIKCPGGCEGTGRIKMLRRGCTTCHRMGKITLTKYLKILGKVTELKNVLEYEEHITKEILVNEVSVRS